MPILHSLAAFMAMVAFAAAATEKPNVLLLTVDDMSCDSVGVYGCAVPGTTPHMDQLASQSMRFEHAHVVVGNCYPSRNVMWSGLYPHHNRIEGFYPFDNTGVYPHLADLFQQAGYLTAIRGKVTHSTPYHPYPAWNLVIDYPQPKPSVLKDVASYGRAATTAIEAARAAGKPWCLNINISDPHKPFYTGPKDPHQPSRVFTADDMVVPGFLFEDPAVREELALYYSSVRRADDAVGAVLQAVRDAGHWGDTIILFASDHGMPLPFAKTSLFHHSTRTPLMIRWPGHTEGGTSDDTHMVSAVDFLPTLLEMTGITTDAKFDGRSFVPLLTGGTQENRDHIVKVYNENSGGNRHPMRGIQTKRHLYLFNPWADGENRFKTATQGTATYRTMVARAAEEPAIAKRLAAHDHRTYEEFYDVVKDPDCLANLIDDPESAPQIESLRHDLTALMEATGDHAIEAIRNPDDPALLKAYVDKVQAETDARRAQRRKGKARNPKKQPGPGKASSAAPGKSAEERAPVRQARRKAATESAPE